MTDRASQPSAQICRICLGDICESEQQRPPAWMRDGAAGQSFHGKPGGLRKLCQLDVVDTVRALHDQMHAARLEF